MSDARDAIDPWYQQVVRWQTMPLAEAMAEIRDYEKATGYSVEYAVEPSLDGRALLVVHRLVRWREGDLPFPPLSVSHE